MGEGARLANDEGNSHEAAFTHLSALSLRTLAAQKCSVARPLHAAVFFGGRGGSEYGPITVGSGAPPSGISNPTPN